MYYVDVSTDGKWCYIVFWVIGKPGTIWSLLKKRLMDSCPSVSLANSLIFYRPESQLPKPADVFLLKFCCHDRQGLLHGTTLLKFVFRIFSIFVFDYLLLL